MTSSSKISLILLSTFVLFLACSSSQQAIYEEDDNSNENTEQVSNSFDNSENASALLSRLSDTYYSNGNNIPEEFARIKKEKEVEVDLTKGYRIQVYSGQDVFEADTVASRFRAWSDTTIVGYQAETYTFFKTPYYRVHVGDFHDRDKALDFSKLVKRLFRDAWVVYDTVDPYLVPVDTVQIRLQKL
jgi:hypothetical protein